MRASWAYSLCVGLVLAGCGRDDDGGGHASAGGEGGAGSTAFGACRDFCEAQREADCGLYSSAGECYAYECNFAPESGADCLSATEAYFDCMAPAAARCDLEGCIAELDARVDACN